MATSAASTLRRVEMPMPRVVGQRVAHRADHVRGRVQPDDIDRAEARALRPADRRTGQRVDDVERKSQPLRVHERGDDREHADAVRDEVRRVLRADHALAERRREERLERIEQRRLGRRPGHELHQMHVTRRIEEMHAAEPAIAAPLGQRLRQCRERQPRGIGREHRVRREVRRDLRVQLALPVGALGDRLDDEVALRKTSEVAVVVRRLDACGAILRGERRGSSFASPASALRTMPSGSPSFAARSNSTTGTPTFARCAAICAPMTPAPSTAARRTARNGADMTVGAAAGKRPRRAGEPRAAARLDRAVQASRAARSATPPGSRRSRRSSRSCRAADRTAPCCRRSC